MAGDARGPYLWICLAAALASFLAGFTVGKCADPCPGRQAPLHPAACVERSSTAAGDGRGAASQPDCKPNAVHSGLSSKGWLQFRSFTCQARGFPGGSAGKESACSAGDPIRFLGREDPLEKGLSYPLQYSWASLVAQLVKNPPAMQETPVPSLGWEDLLEKGKATHSSILGLLCCLRR